MPYIHIYFNIAKKSNNRFDDVGRIPSFVAAYVSKAHLEKLYIAVDINVTFNVSSVAI